MELHDRAGGGDGCSAEPGEVIAIGMDDPFDQTEDMQAMQLTGECRVVERDKRFYVSTAHAMEIELGSLQGAEQGLLGRCEEVQALDDALAFVLRFGQSCQVACAGGGVIQSRQEFQIAAIAAGQNLAQVDEAVNGLLQRCDLAMYSILAPCASATCCARSRIASRSGSANRA